MTPLPPELEAEFAELREVRDVARRFVDACRSGDQQLLSIAYDELVSVVDAERAQAAERKASPTSGALDVKSE